MTILDRYIARQYLFNALALLVLLFCFVVMIDVALNLDRFIDAAARLSRAPGGGRDPEASVLRRGLIAAFLVADLWWPRLVQLYNYMIGMVLVGAMGFTFAQLVRHRELVAMLAGGVSLYRAARPVLVVALGFLAVAAVNQELAIPRLAEEGLLTRDHGDAGRRDWRAFEVRPMRDGQGRVLHARRFVPAQGRLEGVNIWERDETMRAVRRVSAASATWREGGWWLEGSVEEPLGLGASGVSTGRAAGGARPGPEVVRSDLDPRALLVRRYAGFSHNLSWAQIGSMLGTPGLDAGLRERLDRVRFGRISAGVTVVLALVVSMPFFLAREPKNMLAQSLKCAPVAIGALVGGVIGAAWPVPGVPAAVAVFLPVLVLLPVAIAMVSLVRT